MINSTNAHEWPYQVDVTFSDGDWKMVEWCESQFGADPEYLIWDIYRAPNGLSESIHMCFKHESDALLFAVTWA
jgi:hypothetical protein